jgi:hypothetical protein
MAGVRGSAVSTRAELDGSLRLALQKNGVNLQQMLGALCAGTSDSPVTTPQFYSASYTEDTRRVTNYLVEQFPSSPLVAVGWSLGANILMKWVMQMPGVVVTAWRLCITCWQGITRCTRLFDLVARLLRRYLGEEGAEAPFVAAASLCKLALLRSRMTIDRMFGSNHKMSAIPAGMQATHSICHSQMQTLKRDSIGSMTTAWRSRSAPSTGGTSTPAHMQHTGQGSKQQV